MKAAYYARAGSLELVEMPDPVVQPGEALVRVDLAGICGSDVHVLAGRHPTATFPVVPGHEFVGRLAQIDASARTGLRLGDRVVAQPYFSCGHCVPCITGRDNICAELKILGIHRDGCFAEYVRIDAAKVYRVPDGVDETVAALTEPLAVAVHDVHRSGLRVGQRTLVIGGGPIGMLIAIVARAAGADVTVAEVSEARVAFAESLGFRTVDPRRADCVETLAHLTQADLFDVVFEASGNRAAAAMMTRTAKIGGTVMIVGMADETYAIDTLAVFAKELRLQGVRIHAQQAFAGAVDLLASGTIDAELRALVSGVFVLDDVVDAFKLVTSGSDAFKVLLRIDDGVGARAGAA